MKGEGTGSEIRMEERLLTPKMEKASRRKGDKIKRKEE
jgi:hypothetical protein